MNIQTLKGFRALKTNHCITGSMRHIYEFHNYPISEDLLLGLGSGLGFVYWHMKGTLPFFGGRANLERAGEEGLEKTAGKRTGVVVTSFRTSSNTKAERAVLDLLARGEPVMIRVDMGFLPYLDLPKDYHFGAHAVVLAGHDAETREALVADRDGKLHPISMRTLTEARASKFKPFPPRNAWYTFDFVHKRPPKRVEIRQSIQEVARGMLNPPISNFGVRGIRTAAERMSKWPEIMSEQYLRLTCFNVHVFIDAKGGSGGGIFRYMYSRFLKEAAALLDDHHLSEAGEAMQEIGDRWQQVAQVLYRAYSATKPANPLPEAAELIKRIADREQAVWESLCRGA